VASEKVATLVREIQIREKFKSVRQVFEIYPYLGELYYKELQGADVDLAEFKEDLLKKKKDLLLG